MMETPIKMPSAKILMVGRKKTIQHFRDFIPSSNEMQPLTPKSRYRLDVYCDSIACTKMIFFTSPILLLHYMLFATFAKCVIYGVVCVCVCKRERV